MNPPNPITLTWAKPQGSTSVPALKLVLPRKPHASETKAECTNILFLVSDEEIKDLGICEHSGLVAATA